jgi:hypothetical protein
MKLPIILETKRFKKTAGLALWPFIIVQKGLKELYPEFQYNRLINHEKIHHRQQLEMLIIPFYVAYAMNFLWNFIKYRNAQKAYRYIVFEKEAYLNDRNLDYLKKRKWFACFRKLK